MGVKVEEEVGSGVVSAPCVLGLNSPLSLSSSSNRARNHPGSYYYPARIT